MLWGTGGFYQIIKWVNTSTLNIVAQSIILGTFTVTKLLNLWQTLTLLPALWLRKHLQDSCNIMPTNNNKARMESTLPVAPLFLIIQSISRQLPALFPWTDKLLEAIPAEPSPLIKNTLPYSYPVSKVKWKCCKKTVTFTSSFLFRNIASFLHISPYDHTQPMVEQ